MVPGDHQGAARRRRIAWRSPPPGGAGGFIRSATLARGGSGVAAWPEAVSAESSSTAKWSPSATIMLFRHAGQGICVMVGLMSGKEKSAIPQNSVGSRSRGWVGRLVCGSCHQLGNHSWWWEPPDSNRRPPACKARSGRIANWGDDERPRSWPQWHCPWLSARNRSRLL